MKTTVSILFTAAVLAIPANAVTVLVDFGGNDLTTSGNYNNIGNAAAGAVGTVTVADAIDDTGAASGISIAVSGGSIAGAGADFGTDATDYPASISSQPLSALSDSFFIRQNAAGTNFITVTLGNLDPASTYDLQAYGARGNNGTNAVFAVGGLTDTFDPFNNGTVVVSRTGLVPDASNEIVLTVTTVGTAAPDAAAINFLSVTAVPEPSTSLLALCGVMGLLRRCRA